MSIPLPPPKAKHGLDPKNAELPPTPGIKPESRAFALPAILKKIEARYAQAGTVSADFIQINESAALKTKRESSGTLRIKRPGKVRWETLKPNGHLLVSDGVTFWSYTPPFMEDEKGQVLIKKTGEMQSTLATVLLSGAFSKAKGIAIKPKDSNTFELIPKRGVAGSVRHILLVVDAEKELISRVVLTHEGGNRADIALSGIELGVGLEDSAFVFVAPEGTEQIQ